MRESEKRLFKSGVEHTMKIGVFFLIVIIAIYFVPGDAPKRIGNWWDGVKRDFRERHQPFYEFLVGKDMERAKDQYGQFKKRQ